MGRRLIECVPNFSEGRDIEKVRAISGVMRSVSGVYVLDEELDADHNRSVITLAGAPEAVAEAAVRGVGKAVELIDLNLHTGAHPRIGAADVVPFVPVEGVTLEECVDLARKVGEEIWSRYRVPVYFYEAAASRPDRMNLENLRRGQYEGLRREIEMNPNRKPDIGEPRLHPKAGATVVGARKFLIAYNINLNTPDVEIAKKIAKAIRFSSGGFRYVKAMGVSLNSRNLAQVSMNLTDFEQTPVHRVFEMVRTEAARYGASIVGSEIVGLIPRKALEMAADFYLRVENYHEDLVLENRLANTAFPGGLNEFLDSLAMPTATPGGGSASAAAGAMAAALGSMVAGLAKLAGYDFGPDRRFLTEAVERDSAAFQAVIAAYKRTKEDRSPFVQKALVEAAKVPMEVAERVGDVALRLEALKSEAPDRFVSDVLTALALSRAAMAGATANVRINLESITDEALREEFGARLAALDGR